MNQDITMLLQDINEKTSAIQRDFSFDKNHRELEDFRAALSPYQGLEDILSNNGKLSEAESKVVGAFYSVLAFRMADTSTKYDAEKFEKAKEIILRAEKVTLGLEPEPILADYLLRQKKALYSEKRLVRNANRVAKYTNTFRAIGSWLITNDYINSFYGIKKVFRTLKIHTDSTIKSRACEVGRFTYEHFRAAGIQITLMLGVYGMHKENYILGAVGLGIAIGLPLYRFSRTRSNVQDALGFYYMPTFRATPM